jgi:hypothetical protein
VLGNYDYALEQSRKADKWANIGLIVGVVYYLIYMGIVLAAVISEL